LTLALDQDHCLHVSGNMHVVPLIYFRANKPWDVDSLEPVPHMTGQDESHVTYPTFQHDPEGRLIYSYRSGRSGQGNQIFNVYHETTHTWTRLFDQPLFDGEGKRNAYMAILDPSPATDNYYHAIWVWRDTPDASTNHDLSYMRSRDLQHWETIEGKPLTLPVTLDTPGVSVDPVPPQGGILNGGPQLGFGARHELIISYYKFDAQGNTQLYFARFEQGVWKLYQGSEWDYRWEPKGGGSLAAEVRVGPVRMLKDKMTIAISHPKYGSGLWEINPTTMRLKAKLGHGYSTETVPATYGKPQSTFPGIHVMWASDLNPVPGQMEYRLRWEALGPHRDRPVDPPLPAPSMLQVLEIPKHLDGQ
ncbi:MAG: BNR repeat-containing protein, partial [Abitibacteriaceae bacterium]|nr:BNR repeat-containing protein [Abditibacteriaceae bacterium]